MDCCNNSGQLLGSRFCPIEPADTQHRRVDYYYRIVQKKETIYGIARELNIPKEDIVKYNPSVATGLKKDQVLYFPVDAYVKRQAVVRPKEHKHTVKTVKRCMALPKCTDSLSPNCCKQTPKQGPDLKQTLC